MQFTQHTRNCINIQNAHKLNIVVIFRIYSNTKYYHYIYTNIRVSVLPSPLPFCTKVFFRHSESLARWHRDPSTPTQEYVPKVGTRALGITKVCTIPVSRMHQPNSQDFKSFSHCSLGKAAGQDVRSRLKENINAAIAKSSYRSEFIFFGWWKCVFSPDRTRKSHFSFLKRVYSGKYCVNKISRRRSSVIDGI